MIRTALIAVVAATALTLAACTDTPTTSTVPLGKTSLDDFFANDAWNSWFQTNYDTYPEASDQAVYDQYVQQISASIDSSSHEVIMVVKPSCGCQETRLWMPRVMKVLDAAGFPRSNYELYVTDASLEGIDSVKAAYTIGDAPTFLVLKNGVVKGRIVGSPDAGKRIEQELADIFSAP